MKSRTAVVARARRSSSQRLSQRRNQLRSIRGIERLEPRQLLAINVLNTPTWTDQGPGPINNGQVTANPNNAVTGAIEAIAVHPTNANMVFAGTVAGGVWRTADITGGGNLANINWVPLSDELESLYVGDIEFDPSNPNTLYVGTGSYSNTFRNRFAQTAVGLYRTTDATAATVVWENLGRATFQGLDIRRVVVSPTNPDLIFVAAADGNGEGGLFRSVAGTNGQQWTELSDGVILPFTGDATEIAVDPNNASRYYATAPNVGVFRTDDAGNNWTRIDNLNTAIAGIAGSTNIEMGIHDAGATTVIYAGVVDSNGMLSGVFRYAEDGMDNNANMLIDEAAETTWTIIAGTPAIHTGGQGFNNFSIVADPANANLVYVGGDRPPDIFRGDATANGGMGGWFQIMSNAPVSNRAPHADSRALVFLNNTTLMEADDGGLFQLTNPQNPMNGVDAWQTLAGNMRSVEFHAIGYDTMDNLILGGAQDNGSSVQTATGNQVWNRFLGGDGQAQSYSIPGDIRYSLGNNFGSFERDGTQLQLRAPAGVANFDGLENASGGTTDFMFATMGGFESRLPVEANRFNANDLLFGRRGLYESTNRGDNITLINLPGKGATERYNSLVYGGVRAGMNFANVFYAGTENGRLYIRDETGTITDRTAALSAIIGGSAAIDDIVVDPDDYTRVFVLKGNRIAVSTDSGANWAEITDNLGGLTTILRSLAFVDPTPGTAGDGTITAGGLGGVFHRLTALPGADADCTWTEFGIGMANSLVQDLDFVQVDLDANVGNGIGLLLAGTFGRGAWTIANVTATVALNAVLQIVGDGANNDMSLQIAPNNPLRILVNDGIGAPQSFEKNVFSTVQFQGLAGNDTITIDDNGATAGGSVDFVSFLIDVDGGADSDTLFLRDSSDTTSDRVTVTSTTIGADVADTFFDDCGFLQYAALEGVDIDLSNAPGVGDTVIVLSTSAATTVRGNDGNENITVGSGDLSQIAAPVTVVAGAGVDSLLVNDAGRIDVVDYYVDPTVIAICNDAGPPPMRTNITLIDGTLEFARLDGTDGVNRFDVTPSTATVFTIDGNLPPPGALNGDFLSVRFTGTTGRQLTYDPVTGNGMWTFDSPHQNINFENIEKLNFFPVIAIGADAAAQGKPTVKVFDAELGTLITTFLAYDASYREGVRVAVGDINGDGIPEIITAPGRNHAPLVKIFDLFTGAEIPDTRFHAFPKSYIGGVNIALGDLDDDGLNDVAAAPSRGKTEIRTFLNDTIATPNHPFDGNDYNRFLAFDKTFIGGATIAVGDVRLDNQAEIIIGSGTGMRAEVRIFDGLTSGSPHTPAPFARRFYPFDPKLRGGVWVALANIDGGTKFEIVVGAGVGGGSRVATYDLSDLKNPFSSFTAYTGNGSNAPVRVAAVDIDADGLSDIFTAQGPDGKSQTIRRTPPLGPLVDFLFENDPEFRDGFFLAADVHSESFVC